MNNVELWQHIYQLFSEGKVEDVLALFDPSIEWDACTGFPFIHGKGISIGPEAVARDVFSKIPDYYDGFNIDIREIIGADNRVVMVGHYKGTWKATGKSFTANITHVWTVKDGKVTHFFQAVDTAEIINA